VSVVAMALRVLTAASILATLSGAAGAADCNARQAAGYRVLSLDGARKIAVWYPAAAREADHAYTPASNGFVGRVARDARPASCPGLPLVVFSHGFGGCGLQSIFFTEELARHGYVVAAPDHRDAAVCAIEERSTRALWTLPAAPFHAPERWSDRSHADRRDDVLAVVRIVAGDMELGRVVDARQLGIAGHSLGGYTALAMAGGWPSWKAPAVKAVLAFSPYAAPFLEHDALGALDVPVMYQGAQFDWGVTPLLEGPRGAYARSAAPKYFLKLAGGTHFEWTNLVCLGQPDTVSCLKSRPNAYRIDRYGIEFLDRYLKDKWAPLLGRKASGVDAYLFEEK
jgi:predicted dienelactone hydrolase